MGDGGSRSLVLQLSGAGPAAAWQADALLGLWAPRSRPGVVKPAAETEEAGLEFGASVGGAWPEAAGGDPGAEAGEAPSELLWLADLPADPAGASAWLGEADFRLKAARSALDLAPARLEACTAWLSSAEGLPSAGRPGPGDLPPGGEEAAPSAEEVSYAMERGALAGPERALRDLLAGDARGWRDAVAAFRSFATQVHQVVAAFQRIETRQDGQPVGWTRLTLGGDLHTALATGASREQARLHRQTVDLTLETRQAAVRTAALTLAGAAKLAVTLSTPAGVVRSVPAVLHFVTLLRTELENLYTTTKREA